MAAQHAHTDFWFVSLARETKACMRLTHMQDMRTCFKTWCMATVESFLVGVAEGAICHQQRHHRHLAQQLEQPNAGKHYHNDYCTCKLCVRQCLTTLQFREISCQGLCCVGQCMPPQVLDAHLSLSTHNALWLVQLSQLELGETTSQALCLPLCFHMHRCVLAAYQLVLSSPFWSMETSRQEVVCIGQCDAFSSALVLHNGICLHCRHS